MWLEKRNEGKERWFRLKGRTALKCGAEPCNDSIEREQNVGGSHYSLALKKKIPDTSFPPKYFLDLVAITATRSSTSI